MRNTRRPWRATEQRSEGRRDACGFVMKIRASWLAESVANSAASSPTVTVVTKPIPARRHPSILPLAADAYMMCHICISM